MTTHDFYRALGLDPSTPSPQIAADLDQRLAAPGLDATQYDELMTARHILGDPAKRTTYDQALSDPATSLTTSDLYRLARSTPGQPQPAPAFGQQESWAVTPPAPAPTGRPQTFGAKASGLWAKVQDTFRTHPGPAIGGTAVAAVVVVGLIIAGAAAVGGDSTPGADTDTIASGDSGDNGELSLEEQIVAGVKKDVEKREAGRDKARADFKGRNFLKPGEKVRFTEGWVTTNPSGATAREVYAEWDVTISNPRVVHKYVTRSPSLPFEHERAMICFDAEAKVLSEEGIPRDFWLDTNPIYDGDRIAYPDNGMGPRIPYGFEGDVFVTSGPSSADMKVRYGDDEDLTIEEDSLEAQNGGSYKVSRCMNLEESPSTDLGQVTGLVVQPNIFDKDEERQADRLSEGDGWRLDVA